MPDRLERLLNLTATLLDTRRPLTLEELAERLEPGYPDDLAARRRQFERDKETLRELGIPIRVETVDGFGSEQAYRIHPDDYYLPDLALTEDERAALHVAVTAVRLGGDDARDALRKLGGFEGEGAASPLADVPVTPALAVLFDAVAKRAGVTFRHRGEGRHLEPYGVVLRFGHWYVVGHDLDRDAPRAFRVDRIEGEPERGPAGLVRRTRRARPGRVRPPRPDDVRSRPSRRRFGPGRPVTHGVGGRAARRGRGLGASRGR